MKNKTTLQISFFLAGIMFFTNIIAQRDPMMSLSIDQAVQLALQNNVAAKNAELDIQKAKARNWEITTTGLPTITGSVDYQYFFKRPISPAFAEIFADPNSVSNQVNRALAGLYPVEIGSIFANAAGQNTDISFVLPHDLKAGFQLSQLIFDGRYILGLKAAKELLKTASINKSLSDQDIKYNVIKAYHQAAAAIHSKTYLDDTYKAVTKLVNDTREVYKAGFVEELDVNRLELIQANLEAQIQTQDKLKEIALSNLKFQIGLSINTPVVLSDKLEILRDKVSGSDQNFDVKNRMEYELLETALKLGKLDQDQVASGYLPSLFGFLSYAGQAQTNKFVDIFRNNSRGNNNWFQTGVVGLTMSVPIFDSGLKNAQVKQKKLDLQKTRNEFENFTKAAELQAAVSKTNFESSILDEKTSDRSVKLSERIYNINRIKFKEGVGSSFELVQAEQDLIQNQLKKIQSTLNVLNTKADLDKSLGVK